MEPLFLKDWPGFNLEKLSEAESGKQDDMMWKQSCVSISKLATTRLKLDCP